MILRELKLPSMTNFGGMKQLDAKGMVTLRDFPRSVGSPRILRVIRFRKASILGTVTRKVW